MKKEVQSELLKIKSSIWKRFKHESPKLFKIIFRICMTILSIACGIKVIPLEYQSYIPEIVKVYAGHIIAATIIGSIIAKATVNDEAIIKQIEEKLNILNQKGE